MNDNTQKGLGLFLSHERLFDYSIYFASRRPLDKRFLFVKQIRLCGKKLRIFFSFAITTNQALELALKNQEKMGMKKYADIYNDSSLLK